MKKYSFSILLHLLLSLISRKKTMLSGDEATQHVDLAGQDPKQSDDKEEQQVDLAKQNPNLIDCNSKPEPIPIYESMGYRLSEHAQLGLIAFDKNTTLAFHRAIDPYSWPHKKYQVRRMYVDWRGQCEPKVSRVANMNIAQFLLRQPEMIPDEMKTPDEKGHYRRYYFIGTEYVNGGSEYSLPCLYWNEEEKKMEMDISWDDHNFYDTDMLVVLKK